jgi:hypothetical protein
MEVFTNTKTIGAQFNMITKIPPIPSWVTVIYFNGNPLTDITNIFNAPWIEKMNFYGSGIVAPIPSTFSIWPNLTQLQWGKNKFYGILNETAFNTNELLGELDLSESTLVGVFVSHSSLPPPPSPMVDPFLL